MRNKKYKLGEAADLQVLPSPGLDTCGEADLHGSLSVPEHLKLREGDFIGNAHRVGPFVPFISNVSHGVTDCNHKPVLAADRRQRTAAESNSNGV